MKILVCVIPVKMIVKGRGTRRIKSGMKIVAFLLYIQIGKILENPKKKVHNLVK